MIRFLMWLFDGTEYVFGCHTYHQSQCLFCKKVK